MMHPSEEDWMEYLYGEARGDRNTSLQAHLNACAQCRSAVSGWQKIVQDLHKWELTGTSPVVRLNFQPVVRWAAAALVILGLGYGLGHISAPGVDVDAIRAGMEKSLQAEVQQLRNELKGDWQAALSEEPAATDFQRQLRAGFNQWTAKTAAAASGENQRLFADFLEDFQIDQRQQQQMILTLFDRAEQKHQAEHIGLRRALETVAVVAAEKFDRTESQLGTLASYTQAKLILDDQDEPSHSVNP